MSAVETRTVSLPVEQATYIDSLVADGRYASANEVVQAGLEALQDFDEEVEHWLRTEVAPTYDAIQADSGSAIPMKEVFNGLRARRAERLKSKHGE